jgi:hypothetical protein
MQQKLCLWTCVVVLVGALCAGNPFLCGRDTAMAPLSAEPPTPAAPAVDAARTRPDAGSALRTGTEGTARKALGQARPLDAFVPVSLAANVPADPSACPDPALAPLVESTERAALGETVWVLRDGRRLVRNPQRGAGHPLLIALQD